MQVSRFENNQHADTRRACNGGGYHQPAAIVEWGNHSYKVVNHNCGDFIESSHFYIVRDGVEVATKYYNQEWQLSGGMTYRLANFLVSLIIDTKKDYDDVVIISKEDYLL